MILFDWDVFWTVLGIGSALGIVWVVLYIFHSIIHIDPGFGERR